MSMRNDSEFRKRVRLLYPTMVEKECLLPSKWSSSDKYNFLALSHNDLKAQYKGNVLF